MNHSFLDSSVHGISQARMLEWVAIPFPRGSSPTRDWTHVSCIADGSFTTELPGKPYILIIYIYTHDVKRSCSVMSDSLPPHGLQPAKLLCPWDFPGKNTGVGCHFLLQGLFPAEGLNPGLPHCVYIYIPTPFPISFLNWFEYNCLIPFFHVNIEKTCKHAIHSTILFAFFPLTLNMNKISFHSNTSSFTSFLLIAFIIAMNVNIIKYLASFLLRDS